MKERRRQERRTLPGSCPASFEHGGEQHEATMIDVSLRGAGLMIYRPSRTFAPRVGDRLSLQVATPMGGSQCEVRIVWVDSVTGGRRFGVAFGELPAGDPLRSYAERFER